MSGTSGPKVVTPGKALPRKLPPRPVAPRKPANPDEFLQKLIPIFQAEADERLRAVEQSLLQLEKMPAGEPQQQLIEQVMRDAHSIKGGARTVNLKHVEGICQSFESVAHKMKQRELSLSAQLFDTLHATVDVIGNLLAAPDSQDQRAESVLAALLALERGEPITPPVEVPPLVADLTPAVESPASVDHVPVIAPPLAAAAVAPPVNMLAQSTVRVASEKLDQLFRQAQEMLAVKLTTAQRLSEIREVGGQVEQWRQRRSRIDAEIHRLQAWTESGDFGERAGLAECAARVIELLDWGSAHMKRLEGRVRALGRATEQDRQSLGRMVDELLADTRKVLMMPLASLFEALPRMVRDLSRSEHKDVTLDATGADIDIDKRILIDLKDPLVHLVRNCLDHGMETPDEREKAGKPRQATLRVSAVQLGSDKVELTVADDGRGIDTARLREVAVASGIFSSEEAERLSEADAVQLIFRSGLSTSPTITRISGRGLGMVIVRERIERLGGRLSVETTPGVGTTFRIVLPLTLATLRGILLKVGRQSFIVPTVNAERVVRVRRNAVVAGDNGENVTIGDEVLPLVYLDRVLAIPRHAAQEESEYLLLLLVESAGHRLAFVIDEVEDELEVLFKNLGGYLAGMPNVTGATVLGSGKVVPILSVSELVQSALHIDHRAEQSVALALAEYESVKSILVAEDSITSRMLLKEILEAAGYQVTTAVDGADALSMLEGLEVDLVVSDVEMPKMNGFELTERIRNHPVHGMLPVILVTGLERQADRERGIGAGASAYIVKSNFDQSDLLDTIQRLI